MPLHLRADLEANKQRFIRRVRQSRQVWCLLSEDSGCAYCPSNHIEADVLPFWSDKAYALRHVRAEWGNHVPTMIDLDQFIDVWLFNMHQDGTLAGVNFNADLAGIECDARELALALMADEDSQVPVSTTPSSTVA